MFLKLGNGITLNLRRIKYKIKYRNLKLGKNVKIYGTLKIIGNSLVEIGDFSTLNEGVFLNAKNNINIGKYCRISSYAQLITASLDLSKSYTNRPHISKPIILKDGVWICSGAIILPGVQIGEGSIIAAGAVCQ